MPTVLRSAPYRVYFFSHEPNEPPHVRVDRDDRSAKFWLAGTPTRSWHIVTGSDMHARRGSKAETFGVVRRPMKSAIGCASTLERDAAFVALEEEKVLVVVMAVYHAE